jgi:uncharacterized protein YjdB/Leucine-rich repeat (LRR) protein
MKFIIVDYGKIKTYNYDIVLFLKLSGGKTVKNKLIASFLSIIMIMSISSPLLSFAQEFMNPFDNADNLRNQAIKSATMLHKDLSSNNDTSSQTNTKTIEESTQDNYIVKFKESVSFYDIFKCVSNYNYQLLANSSERIFKINLNDASNFKNTYANLIDYINKSTKRTVSAVPNDPKYSQQWAIPDLNLPSAWDITKGSPTIKVAVIDTGIYRSHEDLSNSTVLNGYDLYLKKDGVTSDAVGHGTMVTSIIAATTDNSKGMAGVCWNISVVPFKVASPNGEIDDSNVISAITMAADAGCDVINMSLGGYDKVPSEQAAVDYAVSKGCIVVASSGNEGDIENPDKGKIAYPASDNGVISVAAVNSSNQRSHFSQYNNMVDVCAPGENILVATKDATNSYATGSGTSFSSPYVAAIAALARSVEKSIDAKYFEQLIKETSTNLGTSSRDDYYGWGLINAAKIVDAAKYPVVCGVDNSSVYTSDKTITFNKGTATLSGNPFTSGSTVSEEGNYTLVVTDSDNNKTTVNFFIDKTIIVVNGVEDGKSYNDNRTITFSKGTATLNGNPFSSGGTVGAEGNYTLVVTGTYGNTTAYKFTIDKTPPTVTGVVDGTIYNNTVTINFNEGTALLNGNSINSGSTVSAIDSFTLVVTDAAGNKTTVNFSIDKNMVNKKVIQMDYELSQWVLDEPSNTLYAISNTDKTLLFVNASTLNIDKTLTLEAAPTDIIKDSRKLYIALDSVNKILVVNMDTKDIENTITTTTDPCRIAKDGNNIYYVQGNQWCELHEYDLNDNIDTKIILNKDSNTPIYEPDIAINTELHILYLGESNYSDSKLFYYSTVDNKIIGSTSDFKHNSFRSSRTTLFDGKNVFYAGRAFNPDTLKHLNGDYDVNGTIIFAKNDCVFTNTSIYDENTHIKAGDLESQMELIEASDTGTIYVYDKINQSIIKYESAPGSININDIIYQVSGTPAPQVPSTTVSRQVAPGQNELDMKSEITKWVQDDSSNTLYAISQKNKALFFINSATLNIEDVLRFSSTPNDIIIDNGKFYISFDDAYQIKVIDIATRTNIKTLYTTSDPYRIVKDGNNLYYAERDQWCDIYKYNTITDMDSKISVGFVYYPNLAINKDLHILYIGESQSSLNKLIYYSTSDDKVIGKSIEFENNNNRITMFDGAYVFYAGKVFDPVDPTKIIGAYGDNETVIFAKYGLAFTNNSVYIEDTFEKYMDFTTPIDLVEITDNNGLFTYDKTNEVITQYQGQTQDDSPVVTGVSDGYSYIHQVTISFDKGTALLDGNEFTNGSTVTALGDHTIVVTDDKGSSTTVSFTIYATNADDNTPVNIHDDNLKQALIDNGVDRNNDGIITRGEMRILPKELYIGVSNITDLTGIEYAKNLQALSLYNNSINDLSPLSQLTQLQALDLSQNNISNISNLSRLTNLTELYLDSNQISDLTPLSSLTNLTSIYLNNNKIINISPLSNFKNLGLNEGWLSLADNNISNISPLSSLANLTNIDLSRNQISELSPLSSLINLESLYLDSNKITDISSLSSLTNLGVNSGWLSLSDNNISNISPLSSLINLTYIDLSKNKITDIKPLQNLSSLGLNYGGLNLSSNKISDISTLSNLTNLTILNLSQNSITDISPLHNLTYLNELDLSFNSVRDITPLENLPALTSLILSNTSVKDITALQSISTLSYLDLSNNKIQHIEPLKDMVNLFGLNLSNNKIEFIDELSNLVSLVILDLSNNEISDISAVKDLPLSDLDVSQNYLNLSGGSDDMTIINNIISSNEAATIVYTPQKLISSDIPPVITANAYITTPTNKDITVTVTSDKGKLNAPSHTFTQNGSFDFVATDSAGKVTTKTVTINNIDMTAPVVTGVTNNATYYTSKTITFNEGTAKLNGATFASGSPVSSAQNYTLIVTDTAGNVTTINFTITSPGVTYQGHVQNIGWQGTVKDGNICGTSGMSLRVEAFEINLENAPAGLRIKYKAHVENIGWQDWAYDGSLAGTSGKALRVEALQIMLEGTNADKYSIEYQAHVQNIGWQTWVKDGEIAGTTGKAYRIEAIRIKLVPKIPSVTYQGHVKNIGWQNPVNESELCGTSGMGLRMEALKINLVNASAGLKIKYKAHVENIGWQGWVYDGALSGTSGQGLRIEAIQIMLEGTDADKYSIVYQAHVQNIGWQGWVSDGATAGTTGNAYRIEAIRIIIVEKQ